jgi:hypothetical protein
MNLTYVLLRLLHIGAGAIWVGAAVLIAVYIEPTARATAPEGQRFIQALMRTSLRIAMPILGLITILAGIALYWQDSAGFTSVEWMRTGAGRTFGIGGLFGIASLLFGLAFSAPTAARLGRIGGAIQAAGRPPTPEETSQLRTLQGRLTIASRVTAALMVAALLLMAVARAF